MFIWCGDVIRLPSPSAPVLIWRKCPLYPHPPGISGPRGGVVTDANASWWESGFNELVKPGYYRMGSVHLRQLSLQCTICVKTTSNCQSVRSQTERLIELVMIYHTDCYGAVFTVHYLQKDHVKLPVCKVTNRKAYWIGNDLPYRLLWSCLYCALFAKRLCQATSLQGHKQKGLLNW